MSRRRKGDIFIVVITISQCFLPSFISLFTYCSSSPKLNLAAIPNSLSLYRAKKILTI